MESPPKIRKVEISLVSDGANNNSPTKYKNIHCSRSCMKLYMQEASADVYFAFVTGNEKNRLPAHKYILGIGSPVFQAMFYGSLPEDGDIEIKDVTIDAFKQFLQFFYLDVVSIKLEYVDELMYLASKYDVAECFNVCETFFKDELPVKDICHVLQLAVTYDRIELVRFLLAKISTQSKQIFASNSFENCSASILKLILEMDHLDCAEEIVFDACMVWSERACVKSSLDPMEMKNRREQLGDCFRLIQFALMSPRQLSKRLSQYQEMFTREELLEFIALQSSDKSIVLSGSYGKRGTRNDRRWDDATKLVFSLSYPSDDKVFALHQVEATAFKTNKKLLLGAIGTPPIHPRSRNRPELSGVLKIFGRPENVTLLEQPVNLALGGNFQPRNIIKLTRPIAVEPSKIYEIRIEFDTSWSENVYDTKKTVGVMALKFGNCAMHVGNGYAGASDAGIASHLYFN